MRVVCAKAIASAFALSTFLFLQAQDNVGLKIDNNDLYSGIEVGSKGVKMSLLEVGKNSKMTGSFKILKDTSINTDFISLPLPHSRRP